MAQTIAQQEAMFDCTVADLDAMIAQAKAEGRDLTMMVMGMLSDVQDMLVIGLDQETIRRTLNRAKYLLDATRR